MLNVKKIYFLFIKVSLQDLLKKIINVKRKLNVLSKNFKKNALF